MNPPLPPSEKLADRSVDTTPTIDTGDTGEVTSGLETLVSVCIPTFRRPALLDQLLGALTEQELPPGHRLEVVVVDNDPACSAGPVLDRWRRRGLDVRDAAVSERNISLTRNRTVELAGGSLLCFIDDDERPAPGWLSQLIAALDRYRADVVFGSVVPSFASSAPQWMTDCPYFHRSYPPAGSAVETGGGGNVLLRRSAIAGLEGPFDPAWGRTGGEDTYLFETLHRRGARLVVCPDAVAYEHVPAERLHLSWLLRRAARTGGLHARRRLCFAERPARARALLLVRATAVCVWSALRAVTSVSAGTRCFWTLRAASALGQCGALFGVSVRGY